MGFECILNSVDQVALFMQWRNDPVASAMSLHGEKQIFAEDFYGEYFTLADLPPLFILEEGIRKGFVYFRGYDDPIGQSRRCCEISIAVAPDYRGQGVAARALEAIRPLVIQQGYHVICAEIKAENTASIALFEQAGYSSHGSIDKRLPETGQSVTILQYVLTVADRGEERRQPFIIAEAGSNWRMGSESRDRAMARALIDVAVNAGADAVKFQTYRPETLYVANAGGSNYLAEAGIEGEIHALLNDLAMPYEMIAELATYCDLQGIQFMSTPFSVSDFQAIDPYVTTHKIASYEMSHLRLLQLAAAAGKPLILSTGAATEEEIAWAVSTYWEAGGRQLTLMQCTAKYPADAEAMNLLAIPWLQRRFNVGVGLSDHSRDPVLAPVAAVALGATVIEKHFTLDNRLPGPDHFFAVTPDELEVLVRAVRAAAPMRGVPYKQVTPAEEELRSFARRGLQALHPIAQGDTFREGENVAILRPGNQELGVHPRFLNELEGKRAKRPIAVGSGIRFGDW